MDLEWDPDRAASASVTGDPVAEDRVVHDGCLELLNEVLGAVLPWAKTLPDLAPEMQEWTTDLSSIAPLHSRSQIEDARAYGVNLAYEFDSHSAEEGLALAVSRLAEMCTSPLRRAPEDLAASRAAVRGLLNQLKI